MKMNMLIEVETPIADSPRVAQVRGIFDLPPLGSSRVAWEVALPLEERRWHIGLIVGPSGCGKTTIARRLFPELTHVDEGGLPAHLADAFARGAVVDAFPEDMAIKDVIALLSAVGF